MAVEVKDGYYTPVATKKVTHWPMPDANGTGEPVWDDQYDGQGNFLGRQEVTDNNGQPVRAYDPPAGFRNFPSREAGSDGKTDNYVKVDERGRIWRHPVTGAAASIAPGQTLVEYPNGDFELLKDDFSRYLFNRAHEATDAPADTASVERPKTDAELKAEQDAKDMEEFKAWKKAKQADEQKVAA